MTTTSEPRIITLGTAGGPRWWADHSGAPRFGIATAVVVGERWYLVDCGDGAGHQASAAGLKMPDLGGIFLTHMHSDHLVDLPSIVLFGAFELKNRMSGPIAVVGPGDRGRLTPLSPQAASTPRAVAPERPTPGVMGLFDGLFAAFATDINDRIFDSLARSPRDTFDVTEIDLGAVSGFDPDTAVSPPMEPIEVFRDDLVTVTAVLVSHHPMAPAFAYRFDTDLGSVTISGDTAPCDNVVRLARDTDLLLHEAIDLDILAAQYTDTDMLNATMAHHRRSHTTPADAGRIAARAGAKRLALHHLVPSYAHPEVWRDAQTAYPGPLTIPDDLDILSFARSVQPASAGV
ncbi:MBL fold metallo-hydrolase [Microbacterium halophytorum]|uniref:MBL fold metallo-hydrolase n=1 Tax=Microbacterium halophytorum TaxID=2067568 RepID=UPI001E2CA3A4|nr:MBL fold metallo-hydrolase [Microbacterium halophytorum]